LLKKRYQLTYFHLQRLGLLPEFFLHDATVNIEKYFLVISVFTKEGATGANIKLFDAHVGRLFKSEQWNKANLFIFAIHQLGPQFKEKDVFLKKIRLYLQESAFQQAFALEKKKAKLKIIREWYKKSLAYNDDRSIYLKAQHNYLKSFLLPKEKIVYLREFSSFEESYKIISQPSSEERNLLFNIYIKKLKLWEDLKITLRYAQNLVQAANYAETMVLKHKMLLESVFLFGNFYQINSMDEQIGTLKRENNEELHAPQNKLRIARIRFLNGQVERSWAIVRELLKMKTPPAAIWILVYDLTLEASSHNSKLADKIKSYLKSNIKQLRNTAILQPLWISLLHQEFMKKYKKSKQTNIFPNLVESTSDQPPKTKTEELKARLDKVKTILTIHSQKEPEFTPTISSPSLQVAILSVCRRSQLEKETILELNKLKQDPIDTKIWKKFVTKINEQVLRFEKKYIKYSKVCTERRKELAFLPALEKSREFLCDNDDCFQRAPPSPEELIVFEEGFIQENESLLGIVYQYLKRGAWGAAEFKASTAVTVEERSLLLGFIRVARGDSWNALALLRVAQKHKIHGSHASLFIARIAWRNRFKKIAQKELLNINISLLMEWEKKLFEKMNEAPAS